MECPVCIVRKIAYITFSCGHSVCNTCVLHMFNHQQQRCPMCRADIVDQLTQEIVDEIENERVDNGDSAVLGSRPRRGGGAARATADDGYDSADEIEDDATHIKIRYGAHEVAFIRNDGVDKEISFDKPGDTSFRIIYKNRRCYLIRKDSPDTPVPLNPLTSLCAAIRPPSPIT